MSNARGEENTSRPGYRSARNSNAGSRSHRSRPSDPPPQEIRAQVEKVLSSKESFLKSAQSSFKQFDKDGSGSLDFEETKSLIRRLCANLQLPPVDDETLLTIFKKYDVEADGHLVLDEFAQMYWQLLLRIRDKYYPSKKMRVRRDFFVSRVALGEDRDIENVFQYVEKLGSGSFGEVDLVRERSSGFLRVRKTINKDRAQVPIEQIESEIEVLKSLDHPHIIKVFEVYEDYNFIYIIMEVCNGGELLKRIISAKDRGRPLTEKYVCDIMYQLMNALTYIHSKNVAHKDLKPENILFQDDTIDSPIKVIDFGLAEMFERNQMVSENSAGTALYMAPEVFMRRFSLKCDVWSAGCLMYFLLTGSLPFVGKSVEEVKLKVIDRAQEPDYKSKCRHLTGEAIGLLQKMLQKDPERRVSARDALNEPWFRRANLVDVPLSSSLCDNMKRYMRQSGLKNALVNLMAHQLNVTGGQINRINRVFETLDQDKSGTISHQELSEGLIFAGVKQWDINRIIQALDIDDSGQISYTEFLAACYTWRESELNIVWTAFNKMDVDGDGLISLDEFTQVLMGTDSLKLINKDDVQELVGQIDKNGDGIIDWDEFLDYMRNNVR